MAKVIDRYTEETVKEIGRTKAQVLTAIRSYEIANMPCSSIKSRDIVEFLQSLTAKPQTVGNYASHLAAIFAIARPMWGYRLDDLRFHDLRHEGISRLFEMGWNVPHVAAVSGHRSWISLKRYTHVRETGDKYVGWHSLQLVIDTK